MCRCVQVGPTTVEARTIRSFVRLIELARLYDCRMDLGYDVVVCTANGKTKCDVSDEETKRMCQCIVNKATKVEV